ncbi:hypothetical protein KAU51_04260 [Candidatus Parcubacteria bacterium]|nr:hypothetical protein [Candidatus Parcubacteria bacterium]
MSITLKDTAVDKSNLIKFQSLEVKKNLYSKSDSCFFTYRKYGSRSYLPAGNSEIGIWDGATKIFGGKILNVKKKIEGRILVYDVECKDWVDTLDKKLVTETYENMTVNAIIADIQANYATDFDVTNVSCTTVIEKIDFAALPVSKCLDRLAEITGYHWYVDPDKDIYFFVEGGQSSPFDLTDTNGKYNTQSLMVEDDHSQIKNKVNIQGGSIANVQVSDATSIAAYGEHEVIIRDDTLTSTAEATQKANAVLADYKDPIKKGSFRTYESGLEPGQEINVNSTIRSISQDFIIQSVSFNARTPDDFEYTINIMTQRDKSLMEFLQNQAMQPAPTPVLGNSQFSTNIKFSIVNYHEISWTAGTIIMSDGKEYSIASGNQIFAGTDIIYFKPTTSETVLQFSSTLADGMGSDRLAIGYCVENSNVALGAQMIPVGYHGGIRAWGGENIVARTVIADQIGLNCLVSNLVTTGEFITLSAQIKNAIITDAKIVTLTATKITTGTMNAARINGGDINGVTITGVTITGGTLQTSTSGKRIVITSDEISMYNSAGSLSGKIYAVGTEVQGGPWIFHSDKTYITNDLRITGTFSLHGSGDRTMYLRTATATPSWIVASGSSPYDVQINRTFKPYPGNSCDLGTSSYAWRNLFIYGYSVFGSYIRPSASNSKDLGTSSFKWRHLYLDQNIYLDSGQYIYWNGTSYYLKHDGTNFRINDDLQPAVDSSKRLGYTNMAWYAVHSDNYLGCNLPTSNSGIGVFKKIKKPQIENGKAKGFHAGKRHYFKIDEFPDEMKMTDKDSGEKDIELTRTIGVTVSALRELIEEVDLLKLKISNLER